MRKKRRKHTNNPMLYIKQPELGQPSASMQSSYRTPKKRLQEAVGESANEQVIRRKKKKIKSQTDELNEELSEETEGSDLEENSDNDDSSKSTPASSRKRFRDMTVEEKVNYFVSLPSQVPKMKCEVLTEDERYRGVIYDYEDDVVFMVVIRGRKKIEINVEDIVEINLIGF